MLNLTPLVGRTFVPRALRLDSERGMTRQLQCAVLNHLLSRASSTAYARDHGFAGARSYEEFASKAPVTHYEALRPWIMRMLKGESNVLWPGRVMDFAQSSGTSDGKSKFIPITREGLRVNHMGGASLALACYLRNNPSSRIFSGRSFILGGSFANTLDFQLPKGMRAGDLSATLISRVPRFIEMFYRVPPRKIALMSDWEEKLPALIKAASRQNVTNMSGVPSWFMAVLEGILDYTGKDNIRQVWPHLEVFFHGGINFQPYRDQYTRIMGGKDNDIHYVETYNASEGFFAIQDDPADHAMRLLINQGVFYEFIESGHSEPIPAWEVEEGKVYEMLITSCNGLWRYSPGDTVLVTQTTPLKIKIAGRTKHFINAFGEELMVYNADAALIKACGLTGASVANYTAAPLYAHDHQKGHHQWLIEFTVMPPDVGEFARILDEALRQENSDYDAKRSHSLFLDPAEVIVARNKVFDRWLAATGKRGGQRKVPKLSNDRVLMDVLLEMNH